MTPEQLAKSGSEHGTQRALFAWVRWAEVYGFEIANDPASYEGGVAGEMKHGIMSGQGFDPSLPELAFCHAIPNGGLRDKITAGKLKHEGVLSGIPDVHLPLPIVGKFAGLYVEMKRPETLKAGTRKALIIDRAAGSTSNEQDAFIRYARRVGYAVAVCFDWRSAANEIQKYVELYRSVHGSLVI